MSRFDPDVEKLADRLHLRAEMLNRYKTERPRLTVAGVLQALAVFVMIAGAVALGSLIAVTS